MTSNLQILLDHRPTGKVSPANFRIVGAPLSPPGRGQVLLRNKSLSLDPYIRLMSSDSPSYRKPQEVGAVMTCKAVGIVEASNHSGFKPGESVFGLLGWQRYSVSDGRGLRVVDTQTIPFQAYLGPVGSPGITAWYGLNNIIAPKSGETVLVSAATGASSSSRRSKAAWNSSCEACQRRIIPRQDPAQSRRHRGRPVTPKPSVDGSVISRSAKPVMRQASSDAPRLAKMAAALAKVGMDDGSSLPAPHSQALAWARRAGWGNAYGFAAAAPSIGVLVGSRFSVWSMSRVLSTPIEL